MEIVWLAFTQAEIMIHWNVILHDIYKSQETLYCQHERKCQKERISFLKMEKEIHLNDKSINRWSGSVEVAAQTWFELSSVIFFTVSSQWLVSVWLSTSVWILWPFTSAQPNNASKNSRKLIYNQNHLSYQIKIISTKNIWVQLLTSRSRLL